MWGQQQVGCVLTSFDRRLRARGNGALPVRLVQPDGAEPGDEQVDGEDEALVGLEGKVAPAVGIAGDGPVAARLDEQVVEATDAAEGGARGVGAEAEGKDGDEKDDGVGVVGDEGAAEAAGDDVGGDDEGDEEAGAVDADAREGGDDLGAAEDEARADEEVGGPPEEEVGQVGGAAVVREDDLGEGVGAGGVGLDLDGDEGEEEDLGAAHGGVPHGATDLCRYMSGRGILTDSRCCAQVLGGRIGGSERTPYE